MTEYPALSQQRALLTASLLCDSVARRLAQPSSWRVHSVFQHACNLQSAGQSMLTLQTEGRSLVPGGCILPVNDLRRLFRQDEPLRNPTDCRLTAADCCIDLADAPTRHLRLSYRFTLSELAGLRQGLQQFLPCEPPAGGMYQMLYPALHQDLRTPYFSRITRAAARLQRWLAGDVSDDGDLEDGLRELVGMGIGLTPSADDFLLGILFVMDAVRDPQRQKLVHALLPLLTRTTEISAVMLRYGCAGFYGSHILSLLTVQDRALAERLLAVAEYGHTSGHDILCGIAFSLQCISAR